MEHSRGLAAPGPLERRFRLTWALIQSDLYRYAGNVRTASFLRHFLFTPGFKYTTVMRLCGYLRGGRLGKWTLYPPLKLLLLRYRYKYGIAIPEYTRIGPGLFINRFGGVMVNGDAVIGANCNITHGAMLGQLNRGPKAGSPILGDDVFLAAGCKILGRIQIGDRAAVGANAVVTKDVPDDGVVGGIPAKLISNQGSEGYINRRVWPDVRNGFRPFDRNSGAGQK
ncbi:serine acetyltransferase [Sphingosinicella sp. CPCC 101087]|uniref:serine acetyltransferase n=1 Tax=Sphingosinicella sp. CPCC 101087 TaxID=2497754 RepID=UPI00101D1106|nr:serine acetyltransferase [Sphingosinicella sp. CPCC 101087]